MAFIAVWLQLLWQKFYRNVPIALPNIWIFAKPLNLISFHCNRNIIFVKNYSRIISSGAIRGMKLKFFRNVHNMCLHKIYVFLLPLLMCFRRYGSLKFP